VSGSPRLFFLALLLLAGLFACSDTLTVEQQIIATIREMEAKIEAGERRRFLKHIADDFTGQDGAMTREQVRALVVFQLNRHKRLNAQLFPIHVRESGENSAVANFRALVTGGPNWIPDSGRVYEFETHWRLVDEQWLLAAASWTPVELEEAL